MFFLIDYRFSHHSHFFTKIIVIMCNKFLILWSLNFVKRRWTYTSFTQRIFELKLILMVLTSILISNIWGSIPKKQLIGSPPPTKNKMHWICTVILGKRIIKQEKHSCSGIQYEVWGRAPTGGWGDRAPHCKTFWQFTFQVQLLRSHHVYATLIKILNVHTHQYLLN